MAARQFGAKPEARRTVRRDVDLECEVYTDLWGEALTHHVTDVSEDGLWIRTELLLEVGTEVALTFRPPDWDEPLCVAGRVRRVELRARPGDRNAVGMGIAFEALRADERRRLTRSIRSCRPQESFILDQRTLTGVPVAVWEAIDEPAVAPQRTASGWAAPGPTTHGAWSAPSNRSRPEHGIERPRTTFGGGLDLAASVFARRGTETD